VVEIWHFKLGGLASEPDTNLCRSNATHHVQQTVVRASWDSVTSERSQGVETHVGSLVNTRAKHGLLRMVRLASISDIAAFMFITARGAGRFHSGTIAGRAVVRDGDAAAMDQPLKATGYE
jgi:hypothetical protein